MVTVLIQHGALVNALDENTESVLFHGVRSRKVKVIEALLNGGADIHYRNDLEETCRDWLPANPLKRQEVLSVLQRFDGFERKPDH